jgi:hypothetical protein
LKEVVSSHEGADAQEGSAPQAKVPESEKRTSPVITIAADLNTSKSSIKDPEFPVAVAAESKSSDGTAERSVEDNKSSDATVVMLVEEKKSLDGSTEVSVEDNKSSDATVLMWVQGKQVIGWFSRRVSRRKQVIRWFSRRVSRRKQVIGCYKRQ